MAIARVRLRYRIRWFVRLVIQTARWLAVAVAVLAWLVVVPLVELVRAIVVWLAQRVKTAFRRA